MKTLAQLEKDYAALPDPLDVPRSWTMRQLHEHEATRLTLQSRIHAVGAATETLTRLAPKIAALTVWRDHLTAWRKVLCDALLAQPQRPHTDGETGARQNVMLSLMVIDRGRYAVDGSGYALETLRLGDLMRASGFVASPPTEGQAVGPLPWLGGLRDVERQLRDAQQRHDDAQQRLDDALLDDKARAARDAESKARAASLPRKLRGYAADGSLAP